MWPRVKQQVLGLWQTLRLPSRHYSLGFLTLGGFIAGIVFWGGFNTALEATNTETFCVSCHEMRDNVYVELKDTIHYSNRKRLPADREEGATHHTDPEAIRGLQGIDRITQALEDLGRLMAAVSSEMPRDVNVHSVPILSRLRLHELIQNLDPDAPAVQKIKEDGDIQWF